MINTVFIAIVVILVVDFTLERYLDYLNSRRRSTQLPDELKDVFDAEQYRRQQEYKKVNDRFSLLTSSFSFLVILLMLFLGGFSLVDGWARGITAQPVLIVLVFFAISACMTFLLLKKNSDSIRPHQRSLSWTNSRDGFLGQSSEADYWP
jgi:STE24 endopeptidase